MLVTAKDSLKHLLLEWIEIRNSGITFGSVAPGHFPLLLPCSLRPLLRLLKPVVFFPEGKPVAHLLAFAWHQDIIIN
eukprot:XP_001708301.1 Hypothetical protein GL50803_31631 [Giardia lamblia ATCC 50803]